LLGPKGWIHGVEIVATGSVLLAATREPTASGIGDIPTSNLNGVKGILLPLPVICMSANSTILVSEDNPHGETTQ